MKTDQMNKGRILTLAGMAVMTAATLIKAFTASSLAAGVLIISGLAFFFIVETAEKTRDAESGLSFKRFFTDLKKPGVIPLILLCIALWPVEFFLQKTAFGGAFMEHVFSRLPDMGDGYVTLLAMQAVIVLGEEIGFRGFFLGKGMKIFPFWPTVLVSAVLFAAAHITAGPAAIVICDVGMIFIDAILFALIFRKSGNCLVCWIPHFVNNIITLLLIPLL